MQELPGATIAWAILAFSIGVELGHQVIVIPLHLALRVRRGAGAASGNGRRGTLGVTQPGSALIGVAGLYYLVQALRTAWTLAPV